MNGELCFEYPAIFSDRVFVFLCLLVLLRGQIFYAVG